MLEAGIKAFDFQLPDEEGVLHHLHDYLGKKVVVYFYPKDDTPGCTKQACAFKAAFDEFLREDIVVIGISKDSSASHKKFKEKYALPFILLSDVDRVAIEAYDVWQKKMFYGKSFLGVMRSTYIIDEKGIIIKVFEKASPQTNAQDIINFLKEN